jgi:hypothetical protein
LSSAPARHTDWLAGRAAENNVNCSNILTPQCFHVLENRHVRPMLPQDAPAEFVFLAHGRDAPARGLKGQVDSAGQMPENRLNPVISGI